MHFAGLPTDALTFLDELKANNNKQWFQANKPRYQSSVVKPMVGFIESLSPELANISDCFIADARPHGGSMFRIYRDTRFAKDKTPYKEHIACQFRHMAGKDAHAPGYYLHIASNEVLIGGGIWLPPTPVLNKIRNTIMDNPEQWTRIKTHKSFQRLFAGIEGDQLKRPPRGFPKEHVHMEDLKRKSYFVMFRCQPMDVTRPDFLSLVVNVYREMTPFMQFLSFALDLPFQRYPHTNSH